MTQRRYYSLSQHFREVFGEKVYRVALDAGFTCPNIDGTLAYGGCTYCYAGSLSPAVLKRIPIEDQLQDGMKKVRRRYRVNKFLAYFQAFTNTYGPIEELKKVYAKVLSHPEIVGLAISTRPDSLPDPVLDFLQELGCSHYLWLEIGLQTIHDGTQERVNRWHTYAQFLDALERAKKRGLRVCVHLIFGLPGESIEEMEETIRAVSKLPIDGVKIHSLHILAGTQLAKEYGRGTFEIFSKEEYVQLVCDAIAELPPQVVIHRLTGDAPEAKLVAPLWSRNKVVLLADIERELEKRNIVQGMRR
ncbi:MAG: TIGR01212 family radical SAM protein [Deltaproteobacteria bacterium]|nr:TIGR01212 family radical SAM protein [Deltaproteobacteria bacterium]